MADGSFFPLTSTRVFDIITKLILIAGIAQSVEQLIRNQQVVCSSHIASSKKSLQSQGLQAFFLTQRSLSVHQTPPNAPIAVFPQKSAKATGENVDVHKTASVPAVMSAGIVLAVH